MRCPRWVNSSSRDEILASTDSEGDASITIKVKNARIPRGRRLGRRVRRVKAHVKTALVTGGAGFIGSRLVAALLDEGARVRVLDIQRGRLDGVRSPQLEFFGLGGDDRSGGMMDRRTVDDATEGVDVVFHLALNWDGHSWGGALPLADRLDVNIRGTLNLLEAARSHAVKHFLYASSIAVYGKRRSPVMDEETICRPELWRGGPGPGYAITKLTLERLCLSYHVDSGLPVTVFRIDVVFDDDEYQDLSPETIRTALRGEPLQVGKGEAGASVHVDDVSRAFVAAALNEKAYGQVVNISNPEALISDLEVSEIVIRAIGSKSKIHFVESGLSGPVIANVAKAQKLLQWKPLKGRKHLEEAIVRMIQKETSRLHH